MRRWNSEHWSKGCQMNCFSSSQPYRPQQATAPLPLRCKATGDRSLFPKGSCSLLTVTDDTAVWEKAAELLLYRNITRIWLQLSRQQEEQNRKTFVEQLTVLIAAYQHGCGYLYRPVMAVFSWLLKQKLTRVLPDYLKGDYLKGD